MAHGGARPGAGRKRTRAIAESPIRAAESKIRDRLPWLVDKLFELAEGIEIRDTDRRTGRPRTYSLPPDRESIKYLIDRVMGKPTQPIDVIQSVRTLAQQHGWSEEETAEAVVEAERYVKELRGVGARG